MLNKPLLCTLLISAMFSSGTCHATAGGNALAAAALKRTDAQVTYNGAYRTLDYPGGDVPANQGVCTDVVIRSYRTLGIDLQPLVHEDMRDNFTSYPDRWGLKRPDSNIDHRRVPNLETFFQRAAEGKVDNARDGLSAQSFGPSNNPTQFAPGDVVAWRLDNGLPHIGVVIDERVPGSSRHYVVHNIGRGPQQADVLFAWRMTGHYRFLPRGTDSAQRTEAPQP